MGKAKRLRASRAGASGTPPTKDEVLRRTREMLAPAQRGLSDLQDHNASLRPAGIYNVAVFGRSVPLVLENMRSVDRPGFNQWYERYEAEMASDPVMSYFTGLRNEILKEGPPAPTASAYIEHLDGADIARLTDSPPPGAKGFFIGDSLGGSGWEIEMPDSKTAKFYVQIPPSIRVKTSLHLPDPPNEHRGKTLADTSIESLAGLYLAYLEKLVADAEDHFTP